MHGLCATRWAAVVCRGGGRGVARRCGRRLRAVASRRRSDPTGRRGSAAAALAALPVKGRAPKTGYTRDQFGPAWADTDRDGCDQRNQVLGRDLTASVKRGRCVVLTGVLHDPYTGDTIAFTRGAGTSEQVQIDHVVALSDAWQTGAQALDAGTREMVATDPLNLLAVDGRAPTSPRATATPPPGCRPPRATAAPTSPGRWR